MTDAEPRPYPRIPHLVGGRGTPDDELLSAASTKALLGRAIVVEEKLDGANVAIWNDGGIVRCALRSGVAGMDRAGQLGPLRAWLAERTPRFLELLSRGEQLFAEWLLVTHTVAYDRLPAYLVGLDLLTGEGSFADLDERDARFAAAGLISPPEVWRGRFASIAQLEDLLGNSRFGAHPAEGLIVRTLDGGEPRLSKLVRPGFTPISDENWEAGRPRNRLADAAASWH